jgi:HAE1 family hydrophobic/amphiphilic exporter-1
MGIAVIGGLIFSTFVTLVLVPVVYAVFVRRGERRKSLIAYTDMNFMNGDDKSEK